MIDDARFAQPDQRTVRNLAFLLTTMPPGQAGDALRKAIFAISAGMVEQGWPQADADAFAARFGMDVAAAVERLASAQHGALN